MASPATHVARLALAMPVGLWASPAFAAPATIANGIYNHIIAGVGVFVLLAVLVVGFLFLLGRNASETLTQVLMGGLLVFSVGALSSAATGSAGGVATFLVGWLRAAVFAGLTLVIILLGYRYFFGQGSYQALVPIGFGLVILLSADFFVSAMGGG